MAGESLESGERGERGFDGLWRVKGCVLQNQGKPFHFPKRLFFLPENKNKNNNKVS